MKSTDDLKSQLMQETDLSHFLRENRESFQQDDIPVLLNEVFQECDMTKSELSRRSGVSEPYLHQIFSGRRTPSRDRLLCLCLGLGAPLEKAQRLLKQCGYAPLYEKNRRDAIVLFGLLHGQSVFEVNDALFQENEKTLL